MIKVDYLNDVKMIVHASGGIEQDLSDFFAFQVPGYRFMPKYRNKQWDGKIRLYTSYDPKMYIGLLDVLIRYADLMGEEIDVERRL